MKKLLTIKNKRGYAESLKTFKPAFAPVRLCDFFVFAYGRLRAENNQYQPKLCLNAFSEAAHTHFLVGFLRKFKQMTNTILNTTESTLQSLYRYYSEMKSTWYKGEYTSDQENAYMDVFLALEEALQKLPIQSEEDRKVKWEFLKDRIAFPLLDNNNQINPDYDNCGALAMLDLCNQIAAE